MLPDISKLSINDSEEPTKSFRDDQQLQPDISKLSINDSEEPTKSFRDDQQLQPDISKLSINDSEEPTKSFRDDQQPQPDISKLSINERPPEEQQPQPDISKLSINERPPEEQQPQLQLCCRVLEDMVAYKNRDCVVFELLLTLCDRCLPRLNADDLVDENGNTVFHALLGDGTRPMDDDAVCLRIIRRLVLRGGPAFCEVMVRPDRLGRTPLHLAAKHKLRDTMKFILTWFRDSWQEPLGGVAANGSSALHTLLDALKEGESGAYFYEVIQLMLSQCGDLLWVGDKHGRTPLHIAAQNHQDIIVNCLSKYYR